MKSLLKSLFIALLALGAFAPMRAAVAPPQTFFGPQSFLGDDADGYPVYYLSYFNVYTFDPDDSSYVYKYGFGWLYFFGSSGPSDNPDAYFYDFNASDVLYTAPELYPYLYSFNLDSFLYYFEDSSPREFYEFETQSFIYY